MHLTPIITKKNIIKDKHTFIVSKQIRINSFDRRIVYRVQKNKRKRGFDGWEMTGFDAEVGAR